MINAWYIRLGDFTRYNFKQIVSITCTKLCICSCLSLWHNSHTTINSLLLFFKQWQKNVSFNYLYQHFLTYSLLCFPWLGQEADVTFWTCGQGGHCRRFCYAHEYVVGYHGCPRRFRYHRFWPTENEAEMLRQVIQCVVCKAYSS